MTSEDVRAAAEAAGFDVDCVDAWTWAGQRVVRVYLKDGRWSYDDLRALAEALGTTKIDVEWERGFTGSEVTPGDRDDVYLEITWS